MFLFCGSFLYTNFGIARASFGIARASYGETTVNKSVSPHRNPLSIGCNRSLWALEGRNSATRGVGVKTYNDTMSRNVRNESLDLAMRPKLEDLRLPRQRIHGFEIDADRGGGIIGSLAKGADGTALAGAAGLDTSLR